MANNSHQENKELSLGTILQDRRSELKLTVTDVCNHLKIKPYDVELMEKDEWEKVSKRIYAAGLVRSYVKFLKITDLDLERRIEKLSMRHDFKSSKHKLNLDKESKLSPTKDSFFNFLLISVLLFLVLLLLYNSFENRDSLITNKDLIKELRKIEF